MKKFLLLIACLAVVLTVGAAPQRVNFDKLPQNSQTFIQKNFPREKVKYVEMDREASWDKYTVYFNSGSSVSFEGGSGDWAQIIMKQGSVPAAVIPVKIRNYVKQTYPSLSVMQLETTADGFKAVLSDRTVLTFEKNGDFKKAAK